MSRKVVHFDRHTWTELNALGRTETVCEFYYLCDDGTMWVRQSNTNEFRQLPVPPSEDK